jgi:nucleoside-diphosphate-sugar epimerase
MTRRALVTGATGFLGSRLAARLEAEGWEVHAIVRPGSDTALLAEAAPGAATHAHDGTTEGLCSIVAEVMPEVVFHLASRFIAEHRTADVESLVASNVVFATQLAEAMNAAGVHRLVNTGTSWQHFEDDAYRPVSLYAATKEAFEAVLGYYTDATPLRAITLKLFDTYGPGDPRPKLFALLRRVAAEGVPLAMSPGEQQLDLVYVDDVMDAFMAAAARLAEGAVRGHERYPVSSGRLIPLRELVDAYARAIGRPIPIEWGGRPYRAREVMTPWRGGDALPGWSPRVPLDEGLRRLVEDLRTTERHDA